jgi:hypothetical protein
MDNSAKIVSDAIIGNDFKTVFINGKAYTLNPPTIIKIAGATSCLSKIENKAQTIPDMLLSCKDAKNYARALSWLIEGDDKLVDELSEGTYEEVVNALCDGFDLISTSVFYKAASLMKTASQLTATPRQN